MFLWKSGQCFVFFPQKVDALLLSVGPNVYFFHQEGHTRGSLFWWMICLRIWWKMFLSLCNNRGSGFSWHRWVTSKRETIYLSFFTAKSFWNVLESQCRHLFAQKALCVGSLCGNSLFILAADLTHWRRWLLGDFAARLGALFSLTATQPVGTFWVKMRI